MPDMSCWHNEILCPNETQCFRYSILRNGTKDGIVFHSDRGSQYASKGFQVMLKQHGAAEV